MSYSHSLSLPLILHGHAGNTHVGTGRLHARLRAPRHAAAAPRRGCAQPRQDPLYDVGAQAAELTDRQAGHVHARPRLMCHKPCLGQASVQVCLPRLQGAKVGRPSILHALACAGFATACVSALEQRSSKWKLARVRGGKWAWRRVCVLATHTFDWELLHIQHGHCVSKSDMVADEEICRKLQSIDPVLRVGVLVQAL